MEMTRYSTDVGPMANPANPRPNLRSRFLGLHLGCAVSDALGAPLEFGPRIPQDKTVDSFRPILHFNLGPGHWTDDTSQMLCLSQSLSSVPTNDGFSSADQVLNYLKWWKQGYLSSTDPPSCFDIGISTRKALIKYANGLKKSGAWFESTLDELKSQATENSAGNGSLMRVAPVGAAYWNRGRRIAEHYARQTSSVTHPYELNGEMCALYTSLVQGAILGSQKDDLKDLIKSFDIQYQLSAKTKLLIDTIKSLEWLSWERNMIKSTGYVYDTLLAALWSFFTTDSFRDGAIKAINLGNDADTVGCVYGGLAGAHYGVDNIPKDWVKGLRKRELVEEMADKLYVKFVT